MPASLPQEVLSYIRSHELLQPHDRILVGVSGGPDSTALLHLLQRLAHLWPVTLGVAHFDHSLRGADSDADAAWVADLAGSLDLPCHLGKEDVGLYRRQQKISLQSAARRRRWHFFQEIQQQHHYQTLALGHTADDQVELFFLRLLRGAGPEGMKGMWPRDPRGIIRPLLGTAKTGVLGWLEAEGLPFRLDRSNLSRRYRRNRLRLELLPQLLAYNPRLGAAVTRFQTLLQEQEDYLDQEAAACLASLGRNAGPDCQSLPVAGLLALPPALQKRVLRLAGAQAGAPLENLTFGHLGAALRLCRRSQATGWITLPGGWRLVRAGQRVSWQLPAPPLPSFPEVVLPDREAGTLAAAGWTFTWSTRPSENWEAVGSHPPQVALMDCQQLRFPLRLRGVRPGDRFRPLGLSGMKKIQDFLVDAKIPRSQRPSLPLLVSGDEIVWVVGHRLADTVKVTPATHTIFRLEARLVSDQEDA